MPPKWRTCQRTISIRAIKRGSGESVDGGAIDEIMYEGYGPGGSALLIKCLSDNRNRSIADVLTVMNKQGGNLGEQGSVQWMFEQKGVITLLRSVIVDQERFELALIDSGAEDFKEDGEALHVITQVNDFKKTLDAIEAMGLRPEAAGLDYLAKDVLTLSGEDSLKLEYLVDALDEQDDVDTVWTNVE